MSKAKTIQMRQSKIKQALIEQLRRFPVREAGYDKVGISRMTSNRWRKASKKFAEEIDAAMEEGREFMNGLGESQLISLMRQGKFEAIRFWLQHNHQRYANKLELSGTVTTKDEPLSPQDKALLRQAFKLSSLYGKNKKDK